MIKTKSVETTEKYDKDGNLIEKVTREETSEDDTDYIPERTLKIDGGEIGKLVARNFENINSKPGGR